MAKKTSNLSRVLSLCTLMRSILDRSLFKLVWYRIREANLCRLVHLLTTIKHTDPHQRNQMHNKMTRIIVDALRRRIFVMNLPSCLLKKGTRSLLSISSRFQKTATTNLWKFSRNLFIRGISGLKSNFNPIQNVSLLVKDPNAATINVSSP